MSKQIPAIVCLVSFCTLFIQNSVQAADSSQESLKKKTTSGSQTPVQTEQLPSEAMSTPVTAIPPILDRSGNSVWEVKQSWIGYLMSANSLDEFKGKSNSDFLSKYNRQRALLPASREKGYLLYANNKWYTLDKRGNDLAIKTIEGSVKSNGFYVSVKGKLEGNTIIVDKLTEIIDSPEINF